MVLSEQARRNWKVASYVFSGMAGFYGVFLAEYDLPNKDTEKHVFSDVQAEFRRRFDLYVYGLEPDNHQSTNYNATTTRGTPPNQDNNRQS